MNFGNGLVSKFVVVQASRLQRQPGRLHHKLAMLLGLLLANLPAARGQGYTYEADLTDKSAVPVVVINEGKKRTRVPVTALSREERQELAQSFRAFLNKMPADRQKGMEALYKQRFGKYLPAVEFQSVAPSDYKSATILLHTDLPAPQAEALLKEMGSVVQSSARYWGKPCAGRIECYVIRDAKQWAGHPFPKDAAEALSRREGLTKTSSLISRPKGQPDAKGEVVNAKSTVYASDRPGVPLHEIIHGYCGQTFGRLGPTWYAEGMAEVGHYMDLGNPEVRPAVRVPYRILSYLKTSPHVPALTIVNEKQHTGDSWQAYARRWALCHMLNYNPNYEKQFRGLGRAIVRGESIDYANVFGTRASQVEFEFRFFTAHLAPGLRPDLCRWDWDVKFEDIPIDQSRTCRVLAGRGWQATAMRVTAGGRYAYEAQGTWFLAEGGGEVTADGDRQKNGRLEGVLMTDGRLGKPFELGARGAFDTPVTGELYLRCRDAWHELADNRGQLVLKLTARSKK